MAQVNSLPALSAVMPVSLGGTAASRAASVPASRVAMMTGSFPASSAGSMVESAELGRGEPESGASAVWLIQHPPKQPNRIATTPRIEPPLGWLPRTAYHVHSEPAGP